MAILRSGLSKKAQNLYDALLGSISGIAERMKSGFRSPSHNKKIGGAKKSRHIRGDAIDIDLRGMSDAEKKQTLDAAIAAGAKGIGIYNSSKGGTTLHADMREKFTLWDNTFSSVSISTTPDWAQDSLTSLKSGRVVSSSLSTPNSKPMTASVDAFPTLGSIGGALKSIPGRLSDLANLPQSRPAEGYHGFSGFRPDTFADPDRAFSTPQTPRSRPIEGYSGFSGFRPDTVDSPDRMFGTPATPRDRPIAGFSGFSGFRPDTMTDPDRSFTAVQMPRERPEISRPTPQDRPVAEHRGFGSDFASPTTPRDRPAEAYSGFGPDFDTTSTPRDRPIADYSGFGPDFDAPQTPQNRPAQSFTGPSLLDAEFANTPAPASIYDYQASQIAATPMQAVKAPTPNSFNRPQYKDLVSAPVAGAAIGALSGIAGGPVAALVSGFKGYQAGRATQKGNSFAESLGLTGGADPISELAEGFYSDKGFRTQDFLDAAMARPHGAGGSGLAYENRVTLEAMSRSNPKNYGPPSLSDMAQPSGVGDRQDRQEQSFSGRGEFGSGQGGASLGGRSSFGFDPSDRGGHERYS